MIFFAARNRRLVVLRRGLLVVVLTVFLTSLLIEIVYREASMYYESVVHGECLKELVLQHSTPKTNKVILLYTPLYGLKTWFFENIGEDGQLQNCPESRCEVSTDRGQLCQADVALFHLRDLSGGVRRMPVKYRMPDQIWAFVSSESPLNTFFRSDENPIFSRISYDLSGFDKMFDWAITYKPDSEIEIAVGSIESNFKHTLKDDFPTPTTQTGQRDRFALWYVSNCRSSERLSFVRELQKHVDVDIFGNCGKADPCLNQGGDCLKRLKSRYKFYIAFENSKCRHYITEKFWDSLVHGMVPVVMGAPVDDYREVAPPNSFIHVDDFGSPAALAEHLKYLDEYNDAYREYFHWRLHYHVHRSKSDDILCNVCKKLHQPETSRTSRRFYNLSTYWGEKENCFS